MARRVVAIDSFYESLALLDDSAEMVCVGTELLRRAARMPESIDPLPGLRMRVLHSRSLGGFPPVRLFYALLDDDVYLISLERYDELA